MESKLDLLGLFLEKILLDPTYYKIIKKKTPRLIANEMIEMSRTNEKMETRVKEIIILLVDKVKTFINNLLADN